MDKAVKQGVMEKHARKPGDTGSPEVQIALLSKRIEELTGHLGRNSKDHSSRRGLMAMVSLRKRLLSYLSRTNHEKYLALSESLGIRRK
jgi:small subunit ribosomal protein S15